ncbi:glycine cleavage system protein GcvH [Alcanivorax sp. 1008]|uniref:glycine cleavage system protein GcvH n=1 Tax=Alcanivorax sp. 1008 TaxID=2816853 RepID=UPI001DA95072|nr:glycine cleavage system protein GcvH [Alcanivorax sp. 1008]MCC1497427.1 glycine cleavage system protein GcvH [Alcanivorax sp. 1008]MDF1628255.1 glycine cleavage system protein GcvH [Alcanivoracaceae bacterium]
MSNIPAELRYAKSHEWIRLEDDGTAYVGISEHAQEAMGDLVYVELPDVGAVVASSDETGVVESVKAASDIYAPVSGEIIAVNEALSDSPELVNQDCYGDGWLYQIKLSDKAELEDLLGAEDYAAQLEEDA